MRRNGWVAGTLLIAVWLISLLPAQTAPENPYVDAAVCATCHAKEAASYKLTGMGRSFYRPGTEDYNRGLPYYHEKSATWFGMTVRDGHAYQSQYQIGFDGSRTNFSEKQVDYVVGSGNHARTYLSRTAANTLIELPLAWYAERGGYWAMNPGYDVPEHDGFARRIEYNCMFCHNAYPNLAGLAAQSGDAVFPASLPEGIDCQRCHGPGRAHVETHGRTSMVKGDSCLQCHLETTSFPLPNSILRHERGPFSYKAGEPLVDFRLDFDRAKRETDAVEIAGSAYELDQSKCLLKSGAKLTCTTCHDPHDVKHGAEGEQHYNAICRDCHSALIRHTAAPNCVDCHMAKQRTSDAVHVVMTDHRIRRVKPAGDLLAEIAESPHTYRGEVVPYGRPAKDEELYLAEAQVIDQSNLQAGIPRLMAAIAKLQPASAGPYAVLADALRVAGRCDEAVVRYREALRRNPDETVTVQHMAQCMAPNQAEAELRTAIRKAPRNPQLWAQLGLVLLRQSRTDEAVASLVKATQLDPDLFEVWNDLGQVWLESGDVPRAEPALLLALRARPNSAVAHSNLGDLLSRTNRFQEAKYQFEMALRYRPSDAAIHLRYGLALGRARRYPDAQAQIELSIRANPGDAEAQQALGVALGAQGNAAGAEAAYREAIRLRPGFGLANLSLGLALIGSGRQQEALPYLKAAAENGQGAVRAQAEKLLNQRF